MEHGRVCGASTACRLDPYVASQPTFLPAGKCECASSSWASSGHCATHMISTHASWVGEAVGTVAEACVDCVRAQVVCGRLEGGSYIGHG